MKEVIRSKSYIRKESSLENKEKKLSPATWGRVHNTLFSPQLIKGTYKLGCLFLSSLSSLV